MTIELRVPTVGESITEVQIGEWLVAEGDTVAEDQVLVVIETDKVTVELPAPAAGRITKIVKRAGEAATVGEVIGTLEEGAAASGRTEAGEASKAKGPAKTRAAVAEAKSAEPAGSAAVRDGGTRVMPAARRALASASLTADEVTATGPGGRLLKEDVLRHERRAVAEPVSARNEGGARGEEVVPLSPIRRRIAERLVAAQQQAALLTTFNEIDMGEVMALRKQHQDRFVESHGVKLGFLSFFVKATIEALRTIPALNAEMRGDSLVYRNYYDIGIAIGGGKGLVVPVIRNAELESFAGIEKIVADFANRAKQGKIGLEELQGGTFTISNGGVYGSLLSTPIVNPPQSGILGLHAIQDRPVARDGQVVIRPMMYVAVTYDHRLVDGREAVTFLRRIKDCMEQPARMLLEV